MSNPLTTPIVYACAGSSSTGQMANYIALCLDRARVAKMSCIAGVGGDLPAFVSFATWGRPTVVIDGCQKRCAGKCLARHGVVPDRHYTLTDFDVPKCQNTDFDESEAAFIFEHIRVALSPPAPGAAKGRRRRVTESTAAESSLR